MNFIKSKILTLGLLIPCLLTFYAGFHLIDKKKNIISHLGENISIIIGTLLMVLSIIAIHYILKCKFYSKEKEKSSFFYLDDQNQRNQKMVE